ncbi:transcriptional regulator [Gimesia chilikensis]|uniref:transcriptional regulator n=1 Tax=Gimesia chilikensis TaxID=2605989 RepID=UPI003A95D715
MYQKTLRFNQQTPEHLPIELVALGDKLRAIKHPEQQNLLESYHKVVTYSRQRVKIVNLMSDTLAQLRLDVKYLLFDLEVTQSERDSAIAQLKELQ